jgi:hypothetical protein
MSLQAILPWLLTQMGIADLIERLALAAFKAREVGNGANK